MLLLLFVVQPNCIYAPPIRIDAPSEGELIDDSLVVANASVKRAIDLASAAVWVDDVDLLAELDLTPPFQGAGGFVAIGSHLVTVSDFDFAAGETGPYWVTLGLSGLSLGSHVLEIEGERISDRVIVSRSRTFALVPPFMQVAGALVASGRTIPSPTSSGSLFSATLGEPFAARPVGLSEGGELRSGFVEVSQARIARGTP
jgi:hypothetical protein